MAARTWAKESKQKLMEPFAAMIMILSINLIFKWQRERVPLGRRSYLVKKRKSITHSSMILEAEKSR